MSKSYRLKSAIDENASADGDDVPAVKSALDGLGYYKKPEWGITPYVDNAMFDAIERFETRSDHETGWPDGAKAGGSVTDVLVCRVWRASRRRFWESLQRLLR